MSCSFLLYRAAVRMDAGPEGAQTIGLFDALRCARQIPDFVKAIELAKGVAPEQVGRLKWAQRLMEIADPSLTDKGSPLTVAERDSLVELMTNGISRAVEATQTENAPVDLL